MVDVPLIPRRVLFGDPDKSLVRLSPDGKKLSFLAPLDGVRNVWVAPTDAPEKAKPVTHETGRGIYVYHWAYTSEHILYLKDKDGDENWRITSVEVESGRGVELTPLEGVQAQINRLSPRVPEEILVGLNDRDPRFHDLWRVDIITGNRTFVLKNEGFAEFVADDDHRVRLAVRFVPTGGVELCALGDRGWIVVDRIEPEDALTTRFVDLDRAGRVLYLLDSRDRDAAAAVAWNLETGEKLVLAANPRCDAEELLLHPTERTVQAVAFTYERRRWQVVDETVAPDLSYLQSLVDGELWVLSRSLDDSRWIVAYERDAGPIEYWLYDRRDGTGRFLFTQRKELEGVPLARMYPQVIPARDRLPLVSYLTLPLWADQGNCRPSEPLPMVLLVHGGPWGRDTWGYNTWHQWLANRGYAVLSVNFRGSTGFGKAFVNAANREWAGKMHDDLLDAVDWAVKEKLADPKRVAIMGASYGGYATLVGLTFSPEVFASGVDIVGPSSLITLLENIPPYWEPIRPLLSTRVGDPATEEGRALLWERSPLRYVDRIRRPLLIGQGANDPRVKKTESDQIVQAMQDHGIPVTYVLYPDEGHGFMRPENARSFHAVAEAFLARFLGGRAEPIGEDLHGASLEVSVGAEHIPELSAALQAGEIRTK